MKGKTRIAVRRRGRSPPEELRCAAAAVTRAGLEHAGPAAPAAGLQVHHEARVRGGGILVEEGAGAQQARFLAIGEDHHDIAGGSAADAKRADDVQSVRHARGVVGGAGRARHAVVVRHQGESGKRVVAARQNAHQVLHRSDGDPGVHRRSS